MRIKPCEYDLTVSNGCSFGFTFNPDYLPALEIEGL